MAVVGRPGPAFRSATNTTFLKELPAKYQDMIDVSGFGRGERLIFEAYHAGNVRTHPPLDQGIEAISGLASGLPA